MSYRILQGDCREHMRDAIPEGSVHCVVSSPPYFGGIRDYGIPPLTWADGWTGDYGNEPAIEQYVDHTLEIFEGLWRVLRDDGVVWWNLGDTYGQSGSGAAGKELAYNPDAIKRKAKNVGLPGNKMLVPHRVALALQEAGWCVRMDVVWRKPSPMPESIQGVRWERCRGEKVQTSANSTSKTPSTNGRNPDASRCPDLQAKYLPCPGCSKCSANDGYVLRRGKWRPTNGHEHIFMLTKGGDYFCDAVAAAEVSKGRENFGNSRLIGHDDRRDIYRRDMATKETCNPRSVWTFPNEPYKGKHFAAYPTRLVHKCLLASVSSAGCCPDCGAQFAPVVTKERIPTRPGENTKVNGVEPEVHGNRDPQRHIQRTTVSEYRPTCTCNAGDPVPCTVYDTFCGSGTTLQVAHHMGLNGIGSEIGEQYLPLIKERIETVPRCLIKRKSSKKRKRRKHEPTLF